MNKRRPQSKPQTKSQSKASGSIRIIAGKHRGRKLPVLCAEGLRPTTDRVKETLFNWLMPHIQGSHCLDCFSGAGSLGFEAISRGAAHVTMLELNAAAAKQLTANKQLLNEDEVTVINTDTIHYLASNKSEQKFSLVFIDPPFRQGLVEQVIDKLALNWLRDNALIYVELEQEQTDLTFPASWLLLKEKSAGQVRSLLFQYQAEHAN